MNIQEQFVSKGTDFQPTLKTVRVAKSTLLSKLKENRAKHVEEFNTAVEGYRIEVAELIKTTVSQFRKNPHAFDSGIALYETPPSNHVAEYDKVIATLDMSLDDQFYLTEQDISCYILDNWGWKQNFSATTTKYISNMAGR